MLTPLLQIRRAQIKFLFNYAWSFNSIRQGYSHTVAYTTTKHQVTFHRILIDGILRTDILKFIPFSGAARKYF
jgi:hypothetical protein